jgi:bifunctional UDP-N-acetylglucosamine pyrophosphorylase/glucosamine-1-phosphate N-acetyltransferase
MAMPKSSRTRRPNPLYAVILAAGQGKRMFSKRVKLLHPICGRPMLLYVLDALAELDLRKVFLVVGNQKQEVTACVRSAHKKAEFIVQREQLGTGHAVLQARRHLKDRRGDLLILNGDLPTLSAASLQAFIDFHRAGGGVASVLSTTADDPTGYGRVVRNYSGDIARIVEDADASREESEIREINSGTYIVDIGILFPALRKISTANRQGEYYLTDIIEVLRHEGKRLTAFKHPDRSEVLGVNNRHDLALAQKVLWDRKARSLMLEGVTLLDPSTTYIDHEVRIGRDSVVYPGTVLEGPVTAGKECVIGPCCHIVNTRIGARVEILSHSRIVDADIHDDARVGPFAHLRPETILREGSRVGNFVETKKTVLGKGSKANHLAYLGDSTIGREVNVGAGTITCNFDGIAKHRTTIGDEVFIGSDTQLVAPVHIGRGAYVGAGSTITKAVPPYSLAISRARQKIKEGWARPRVAARQAHQAAKAKRQAGRAAGAKRTATRRRKTAQTPGAGKTPRRPGGRGRKASTRR